MLENDIWHPGLVKKVHSSGIEVEIQQRGACSACEARGQCNMSEEKDKTIFIQEVPAGFTAGDKVKLVMRSRLAGRAVLIAYFLPSVVLLFSLFAFSALGCSDGLSALAALVFMALYFFIVYLCRGKLTKVFHLQVVRME